MGTYTQFQLLHDDLPDVAIKIRDSSLFRQGQQVRLGFSLVGRPTRHIGRGRLRCRLCMWTLHLAIFR